MTSVARIYAHRGRIWRFGRVFISLWIGLAAIATIAMAADVMWPFGWGARWQDVLLGLGMVALGFFFWGVWILMFKLLDWLTQMIWGPDPNDQNAPTVDAR